MSNTPDTSKERELAPDPFEDEPILDTFVADPLYSGAEGFASRRQNSDERDAALSAYFKATMDYLGSLPPLCIEMPDIPANTENEQMTKVKIEHELLDSKLATAVALFDQWIKWCNDNGIQAHKLPMVTRLFEVSADECSELKDKAKIK